MKGKWWVVVAVCFGLLSGCGQKTRQDREELPVVRMMYFRTAESLEDEKLVEQAASAYLEEKLGCRLEICTAPMNSYTREQGEIFASDEPMEVMAVYAGEVDSLAGEGMILGLDDLLETEGRGILSALDREYLQCGKVGGRRYGLPTLKDYAKQTAFEYRGDIADAYGLDMDSVHGMEGLEEIFMQLAARTDDVIPVGLYQSPRLSVDSFGNPFGTLMNRGQDTTVKNLYETEEFAALADRMYRWRQKGWIAENWGAQVTSIHYLRSGLVFGCLSRACPGFAVQETRQTGYPIRVALLEEPYIASDANVSLWVIPAKCRYPALAMQVLELLYTDPALINLLTYGIEGKHYIKKADGTAAFPEGITAENSGYAQFLGWMYGNEYLTIPWEGNGSELWQELEAFNDRAPVSRAFGLEYSPENVGSQMKGCQAVYEKYYSGLMTGRLNPEVYLPLFREELRQAGIEEIISDKQAQLDAWLQNSEGDRP